MALELDNSTVSASDDLGHFYYASFDFIPKSQGRHTNVFKGKLFGAGPKRGRRCAVKVKHFPAEEDDWLTHINSAKTAHRIAQVFNTRILRDEDFRIKFRVPFTALMDSVSGCYTWLRFLGRFLNVDVRRIKPNANEFVLLEEYISGDFSALSANNGWMSSNAQFCELQAFAHFTWCYSGGELVVGGVQGIQTSTQYLLTDPTIYSRSQLFGEQDRGEQGIQEFFLHHHCSDICRNWNKPLNCNVNVFDSGLKESYKCDKYTYGSEDWGRGDFISVTRPSAPWLTPKL